MFEFATLWDLYEFKLFMLLITGVLTVILGTISIKIQEIKND